MRDERYDPYKGIDFGEVNAAMAQLNGDKTALARHYAFKSLQNK